MQLWMAVLCHPPVVCLGMQRTFKHHEPYLLADSGRGMTEWRAQKRLDDVAQKWRALVDLRLANFADMYRSGRWRHRYNEAQFVPLMREVLAAAETWARIAPRPSAPAAEPEHRKSEDPSQRTAA